MPDDIDPDDIQPISASERCSNFHYELNSFICSRSEEWDLNRYELIGVVVSELFRQLVEENDDDEEVNDDD